MVGAVWCAVCSPLSVGVALAGWCAFLGGAVKVGMPWIPWIRAGRFLGSLLRYNSAWEGVGSGGG